MSIVASGDLALYSTKAFVCEIGKCCIDRYQSDLRSISLAWLHPSHIIGTNIGKQGCGILYGNIGRPSQRWTDTSTLSKTSTNTLNSTAWQLPGK